MQEIRDVIQQLKRYSDRLRKESAPLTADSKEDFISWLEDWAYLEDYIDTLEELFEVPRT
jgi:hypothetical protein